MLPVTTLVGVVGIGFCPSRPSGRSSAAPAPRSSRAAGCGRQVEHVKPNGGATCAGKTLRRTGVEPQRARPRPYRGTGRSPGHRSPPPGRSGRRARSRAARSPSAREVDLGRLPCGPVGLVVPAGITSSAASRSSAPAMFSGEPAPRRSATARPRPRQLEDEVVRELVEAPQRPEVAVERLREHERVGDSVPPAMTPDEQDRALGRDVVETRGPRPGNRSSTSPAGPEASS